MSSERLRCLHGDRRSVELRAWTPWLKSAAALVERFDRELNDDPFAYNETASVSLLASAASQAGYLALAEFGVTKRGRRDLRTSADGRCDLWMMSDTRSWGFEFKQLSPLTLTQARWKKEMARAEDCALCLRATECNVRVGALVVSQRWQEIGQRQATAEMLRELASECDFAWEIAAGGAASDTFLFFRLIP